MTNQLPVGTFIPPGLDLGVNLNADEVINDDYGLLPMQEAIIYDGVVDGDEAFNREFRISPPAYMTVISQTARVLSDGNTVVDVVIDVEDIPGVANYEVGFIK